MSDEKKLELLADIFECDADELTAESDLEEMGVMDSMTALSLIVMMDEEFGKIPSKDQIKAFKTVGDILAYMG